MECHSWTGTYYQSYIKLVNCLVAIILMAIMGFVSIPYILISNNGLYQATRNGPYKLQAKKSLAKNSRDFSKAGFNNVNLPEARENYRKESEESISISNADFNLRPFIKKRKVNNRKL